ncbi:MAG: DUF393 domain-containing protein [Chlorobi bacterium]|nr:MAG: hypothetical protein UZ07_CHB004002126 [Chlorobi bacterium OLB7]MBK8909938.1 DUF393 domain-containing protein [Chlorobiota bacterium]MBX7218134.1 DUF393 domain-containing protein [Candidatus Kapabacteria bacterium]
MIHHDGKNHLLFDGDCGICTWLATNLCPKMARPGAYSIQPYFSHSEEELKKYGITYDDCDKRLYVITKSGKVFGGAFGVNWFLLTSPPWTLLALPFILLPPLLLLQVIAYKLVAINRHHISRWFGLNACKVR